MAPHAIAPRTALEPDDEDVIEITGRRVGVGAPSAEPGAVPGPLGFPLEIALLREIVDAKNEHIRLLEQEVAGWRDQAAAEAEGRRADSVAAHEHERELVTVIHRLMVEQEHRASGAALVGSPPRRRWWRRHLAR